MTGEHFNKYVMKLIIEDEIYMYIQVLLTCPLLN